MLSSSSYILSTSSHLGGGLAGANLIHNCRQPNCQSGGLVEDVFITGCSNSDDPWGRHFPRNWTRGVIKSYSVWKLE